MPGSVGHSRLRLLDARIAHTEDLGGEIRRPGHRMAQDEQLRPEGLDRPHRVDERFALGHARAGRRDVHDVGRQVLGRHLERDPGPGRRFVEQDRDLPAAQCGDLRDRAGQDLAHRVGRAHDEVQVGGRQPIDIEQVPVAPGDRLRLGCDIDRWDRRPGPGVGGGAVRFEADAHPTGSAAGSGTTRSISTPSSPSISSRWTRTSSSREVGTFLPT